MNNGGPAFPTIKLHFTEDGKGTGSTWLAGMSLLDWFAGQALAGMLDAGYGNEDKRRDLAYHAYAIGEAMLAQRKIIAADKDSA